MNSLTRSLTFMNNKGGVGKTTLACNMAYHLAVNANKKILVLDLDPQCNATQLLLDEEVWGVVLSDPRAHRNPSSILYTLSDIRRGDSAVKSGIDPITSERFKVDVLPGHPSLSIVEDSFSSSWESLLSGNLGGARRTRWISTLLESAAQDYDLVIIDVGPSLGALNRTVMIGSDFVMTPTSADLFSLYALENIADWIEHWGKRYLAAMARVVEDYPEEAADLGLASPEALDAVYLGYTIQQYVSKSSSDGRRRGVKSHDHYRKQIPGRAKRMAKALGAESGSGSLEIGTVPHMFSMVPLAQSRHAPIGSLTTEDGLRGAQISQQKNYSHQLHEIGERLSQALDAAGTSNR